VDGRDLEAGDAGC